MNSTTEMLREQIEQVKQRIVRGSRFLGPLKLFQGDIPNGPAVNLDDSSWCEINVEGAWGGVAEPTWFRVWFTVPDEWQDEKLRLVFLLSVRKRDKEWPDQESLLYINGEAKQGLDMNHRDYLLTTNAEAGTDYLIAICASCLGREEMNYIPKIWQINRAEAQVIDEDTEALYFDALVALEVAEELGSASPEYSHIIDALNNAMNVVDFESPTGSGFYGSVRSARQTLCSQAYEAMPSSEPWKANCVGNSHIDVAWLWTVEETRRKCARTFSTALSLFNQYNEWYFIQSQPQLYDFLKNDYPQLYTHIVNAVQSRRWEATGGMWVEADTILISGESLVRQILFGTQFFQKEFGIRNELLWLPDSFGYTAALPQIMCKSNLKYFMTTKMSWNEFNRIPMDTFWWRGIDGSKILTHLITAPMPHPRLQREVHTYRGDTSVSQIKGAWDGYLQKGINDTVLYTYGHGDGGGGPTREMLERLQRLRNFPAIGVCRQTRAGDFFNSLPNVNWPVWDKELYFECHRGVYTTAARIKRSNRKCELLYRDAEMFSAWAQQLGKPYPQGRLNEGWKKLLRNQCHDIISGVCIPDVNKQCMRDYAAIEANGKQIRKDALKHIVSSIGSQGLPVIVVFNSLSWERTDIVTVEIKDTDVFDLIDQGGRSVPYQAISTALDRQVIAFEAVAPSCGYSVYRINSGVAPPQPAVTGGGPTVRGNILENQFFKIEISKNGEITSLKDKRSGRQVLDKNNTPANVFQFFQDKPIVYKAWDIDLSYYQKKLQPKVTVEAARVIESGPVRAGVEIKQRFTRKTREGEIESVIKQRIYIYASVPRIDFETEVDWQEEQTLLKVAFPVDVQSRVATYDIQFGNVQRPTHWDTDWDLAQFEVWGHKWADLSDCQHHGVSILNDCKYGWDIKGNIMRLTLLRSPEEPDPDVDRGKHCFTYSLYPHEGDWRSGGTVYQAYQLNCPLASVTRTVSHDDVPSPYSLLSVDSENVIVETVKKAEDNDDAIIRIYESYGKPVDKATLTFGPDIAQATECNLVEEESQGTHSVNVNGNQLTLQDVKEYEIITLRIVFSQDES